MVMDGVVDVCKWVSWFNHMKAPKGLHSSIKLNVNISSKRYRNYSKYGCGRNFVMLGTHHVICKFLKMNLQNLV